MRALLFLVLTVFLWQPVERGASTPAPDGLRIITDGPLCTCVVGAEHAHVFIAESHADGPYAWAVVDGELAPGKTLTFDGLMCVVRGVATEAGTYSFTLAVWDVDSPESRAERSYSAELLPRGYCPSGPECNGASGCPKRSIPNWFPVAAGVAVALSFFPLLRRRRPHQQGASPCNDS
jgi:hypothetical protein